VEMSLILLPWTTAQTIRSILAKVGAPSRILVIECAGINQAQIASLPRQGIAN